MLISKRHLRRRNTRLLIFISLLIFLWSRGFNLEVFHFSEKWDVLRIIAVFLIVITTGIRMFFVPLNRFFRNYYCWAVVGLLVVVLFPTFFYSVIVYKQSPVELLRLPLMYYGFFIFFLLVSYQTDSSLVTRLNSLIVGISVANVVFLVIVSFSPEIAHNLLVDSYVRYRFNTIQLPTSITMMIYYSTLYSLVMCTKGLYRTKTQIFYFITFCIFLFYILFLLMGRHSIFVLILTTGYYWFYNIRSSQKIYAVVLIFLFILSLEVFTKYHLINNIQSSYMTVQEEYRQNKGNVGVRVNGIAYYMNEFRKTGYIGFGLLRERFGLNEGVSTGMHYYRYNPNDIGIFAVLFQFGFPAIVLTIIILFRLFRVLATIRLYGSQKHKDIAMAIRLYLFFCIVGLLNIFLKEEFSLWVGLMFFMVWRMRVESLNSFARDFNDK